MISASDFKKASPFEMAGDVLVIVDFQKVNQAKAAHSSEQKSEISKQERLGSARLFPTTNSESYIETKKCSIFTTTEHYIF
jgi:translation elongation factor P/translation initiation factor 5A